MIMYLNFALLITLLFAVNYGSCVTSDEFNELLVKQLVGRIKEPSARGSCPRIVTEVISWSQTDTESVNRLSYEVTTKVCKVNCIATSALEGEQVQERQNVCQTCESTVTVQKEPFKILDEVYNGCDEDSSDNNEGELRSSFENFITKYKKQYESERIKERRFRIFQDNLSRMEHLQKFEIGTAKYGINQFSDLSAEEFRRFYTGYRPNSDYHRRSMDYVQHNQPLPDQFDWRSKNIVSPVKYQGQCGSCWAFATTGVLESQYAKKYDKRLLLSEQELVDCDKRDIGCNGGNMQLAYTAIKYDLGGLEQEADYPYNFTEGVCNLREEKFVVSIDDFTGIYSHEETIAKYLVDFGPIAAAVNSTLLQHYKSGIIDNDCDGHIDHAILLVGYGEETNPRNGEILPYWIIKNSWSTFWGEEGYFRLRRGVNLCRIADDPSVARVK